MKAINLLMLLCEIFTVAILVNISFVNKKENVNLTREQLYHIYIESYKLGKESAKKRTFMESELQLKVDSVIIMGKYSNIINK